MKKHILILIFAFFSLGVLAQSSTMIISGRNYIHTQRPRFIPFLLDSTVSFYKTSVDSLFIRPVQVIGLKPIATSASYNDLEDRPNLNSYLLKSDTASMLSTYVKSGQLGYYLLKSDTSSMLSGYLRPSGLIGYAKLTDLVPQVQSDWNAASGIGVILNKPTIPTNTNQLTNGAGFLTSFTEVDPTVSSYAKSLTAFSVIKSSTDPLYRSSTWVPSWTEVTAKPTIVQQYGTSYTKEFNGKVSTTVSTNEYTFDISSAGFTTIISIQSTGFYSGATSVTQPLVSIKSYSTTSVTIVLAESANTNVLIGGTIEGLTSFLKSGEVFITVKGV